MDALIAEAMASGVTVTIQPWSGHQPINVIVSKDDCRFGSLCSNAEEGLRIALGYLKRRAAA